MAFLPGAAFLAVSGVSDPRWSAHWNLSSGLLRHGTLGYQGERVTNIEPGYPFFLALARAIAGENLYLVLLLQVAVAALGAVFLYLLTQELTGNRKAAWLAAGFYSFYPYLIGQSIAIIEVPLFTPFLIGCACFYIRACRQPGFWNNLLCGLVFGLTILIRSMIFPALALSLAALLWQKKLRIFFTVSAVSIAVISPWLFRSHSVDGTWVPPRSGWNLLQGNCPYSDKIIPAYNPDLLDAYVSLLLDRERPDLANAPERDTLAREVDAFFKDKAVAFMKEHPWRTVQLKLRNVLYFFYPRIVPFQSMNENSRIYFLDGENFKLEGIPVRDWKKELAHSVSYTFLLAAAAIGWCRRRKFWREDLFFYFVIFNFTVVYSLYWPATRLRVPMDFIFMFYAACALTAFSWPRRLQWKTQSSPAV